MSGTPMSVPCQYPMRLFGIAMIVLLSSLLLSGSVVRVLEHEKIPLFFLFTGKTVGIEPATSLFTISRPADDAIVRK